MPIASTIINAASLGVIVFVAYRMGRFEQSIRDMDLRLRAMERRAPWQRGDT